MKKKKKRLYIKWSELTEKQKEWLLLGMWFK